MLPPPLTDTIARAGLAYLQVEVASPTLAALDALVAAYTRRVPWESVSRIVRRAQTLNTADCPRWPELFWQEAITLGMGGTCYESNYAFAALLAYLGYDGYLTINNMRELIGCHAAIVITLGEARYLVDVGLPVYIPLPLDANTPTTRESLFHTYTVTPDGNGNFLVERDRHPRPDCYTLIDTPVADADYRAVATNDYALPNGQFLDRVIVLKVLDNQAWRFTSADGIPYHLETFVAGGKTYYHLGSDPAQVADQIAAQFGLRADWVRAALQTVT